MNTGFIWTAYGIKHQPLKGYKQIFAFNRQEATERFRREYGNDSSILYLVGDIFSQWEEGFHGKKKEISNE
tara:strand:- start:735 stop:947 length:213 start_codon:yes stop_codon:yes gene_type:complete